MKTERSTLAVEELVVLLDITITGTSGSNRRLLPLRLKKNMFNGNTSRDQNLNEIIHGINELRF
eukprot:Pgem_evm1s18567